MKKYVFEITYEVVKEVVVEADDYEEAEDKLTEGRGEVISEEEYDYDFTCIKMPENLEEEK
tara:strand:+ start:115 stop:297 length:183 start_codon:yes stop_codon:yes gene_type:complete